MPTSMNRKSFVRALSLDDFNQFVQIWITFRDEAGSLYRLTPREEDEIKYDEIKFLADYPPAALQIPNETAAQLFQALWDIGFRPKEIREVVGSKEAMEANLVDLRNTTKLLFNLLELTMKKSNGS